MVGESSMVPQIGSTLGTAWGLRPAEEMMISTLRISALAPVSDLP
jgi:hypothetical protein